MSANLFANLRLFSSGSKAELLKFKLCSLFEFETGVAFAPKPGKNGNGEIEVLGTFGVSETLEAFISEEIFSTLSCCFRYLSPKSTHSQERVENISSDMRSEEH